MMSVPEVALDSAAGMPSSRNGDSLKEFLSFSVLAPNWATRTKPIVWLSKKMKLLKMVRI